MIGIVDCIGEVLGTRESISDIGKNKEQTIDDVRAALAAPQSMAQENVNLAETVIAYDDQSSERITRLKETMVFFEIRQIDVDTLKVVA